MDHRKEKAAGGGGGAWMSVPQFGGWDDHKTGGATDYSMVFQRARANKKQQKTDFNRGSLGNEEEFMAPHQHQFIAHGHEVFPSKAKRILSYLNCCIKA